MIDELYLPVIEGLIFASEDPISADEIVRAIVAISFIHGEKRLSLF